MKKRMWIVLLPALALILAACTSIPPGVAPTQNATQTQTVTPPPDPTQGATAETHATQPTVTAEAATEPAPAQPEVISGEDSGALTRQDDQGQVVVVVTPLNLNQPGETLNFDVGMDTHSVDLSMDLAELAELTTDTGKTVQPTLWDAPRGGHHVFGVLSFPASADGAPFLAGAQTLTLTVRGVDVPERVFTWQLTSP